MAREIYIVNATQVVVSSTHPEGLYSTMPNYPIAFDSRSYNATEQNPNGDTDAALRAAKAEYFSRLSANYAGSATRVMATVTLTMSNGRTIMSECIGSMPDMTPAPTPEPEPEIEAEPGDGE